MEKSVLLFLSYFFREIDVISQLYKYAKRSSDYTSHSFSIYIFLFMEIKIILLNPRHNTVLTEPTLPTFLASNERKDKNI